VGSKWNVRAARTIRQQKFKAVSVLEHQRKDDYRRAKWDKKMEYHTARAKATNTTAESTVDTTTQMRPSKL
jgi:hypothetical protein